MIRIGFAPNRIAAMLVVTGLAVVALNAPVLAQDEGGVGLDPSIKDGPHGLARPMQLTRTPFFTAQSVQNGMTAADHQAADQNAISALRGDPGYLSGFQFGTPLAASRQPPVVPDPGWWARHHAQSQTAPVIINNLGPVVSTSGNGAVVQQKTPTGSGTNTGPIALQPIAATSAAPAGATGF